MERNVIITKDVYDYVEDSKRMREYDSGFSVCIGDVWRITGYRWDRRLVFLEKDDMNFYIPADVIGVDMDELKKDMERERTARWIRDTLKEQSYKTDWINVQNSIAIELAKIEFSDRRDEWLKDDNDRINRIVSRARSMTVGLMVV